MTDAPERIWAWTSGQAAGLFDDEPHDKNPSTEYIRADLSPSPEVVKELVEALRFYADEENYKGYSFTDPCGCCSSWYEPKIHIDGEDSGDRARAVLAKLEGGE